MLYAESFLKTYAEKHDIELTPEIINGLNGYNPIETYKFNENNFKLMTSTQHRLEVGKVSNLIVRMKDRGATAPEMIKAFRHLLTTVDAENIIRFQEIGK